MTFYYCSDITKSCNDSAGPRIKRPLRHAKVGNIARSRPAILVFNLGLDVLMQYCTVLVSSALPCLQLTHQSFHHAV
jgi:hypothetical protein